MSWFIDDSLTRGHAESATVTYSPQVQLASRSPFKIAALEVWSIDAVYLHSKQKKEQKASALLVNQDLLSMVHLSRPPAQDPSAAYDETDIV